MKFEYDPAKRQSNKSKHGIDFEETKALWSDDGLLKLPSAYTEEDRSLFIGRIDSKHWTAVTTRRGEVIRIISCRRSRKEEVIDYEQNHPYKNFC